MRACIAAGVKSRDIRLDVYAIRDFLAQLEVLRHFFPVQNVLCGSEVQKTIICPGFAAIHQD